MDLYRKERNGRTPTVFTTSVSGKEDLPEDDISDLNPEVVVSVPVCHIAVYSLVPKRRFVLARK